MKLVTGSRGSSFMPKKKKIIIMASHAEQRATEFVEKCKAYTTGATQKVKWSHWPRVLLDFFQNKPD